MDITIPELTKRIMDNKRAKGFNVTDLNEEFCHLYGEVAEFIEEGINVKPDCIDSSEEEKIGLELADICIFLFAIANISKVDLRDYIIFLFDKHINVTEAVKIEFYTDCLGLYNSVSSAYDSYFKKKSDFGEKLGIIFINIFNIASLFNINLFKYISKKVEINEKRIYEKINGVAIKEENVEEYKNEEHIE